MKYLLLLRHAKAIQTDSDDFDRPLSKRGRKAAALLAKWMQRCELLPNLVLCSPAQRTRETWQLLQEHLELDCETRMLKSLYCASAAVLLSRIHTVTDSADKLLVVGHNPGLEELAINLAALESKSKKLARMSGKFPTGALAVFEAHLDDWQYLDTAGARLIDFVRPIDLS